MADISITRGDTYVYDGAYTLSGVAANLTGCTISFTVKRNLRDAITAKIFQKTIGSGIAIVSAAGGTFTVTISPSDTSSLTAPLYGHYDCEVTDSTGAVVTTASGSFDVALDVTTAT